MWPWRTTVGASAGPTSAITTGRPRTSSARVSIPRASSEPWTNPAASEIASGSQVSKLMRRFARTTSSSLTGSPPGDRKEGFGPVAVFLRPVLLGAAVLGLGEALFGVGELLFQPAAVEVLGRDRLLEQEPGPVAVDLQPAVGLGPGFGLRVGEVEAELGRPQRRQHRRVVGEDADFADLRA